MDELDKLVQAVLSSPKYKNVCADAIRNIGWRELAKRRSWKEALKATKNKLHQVGGAYFGATIPYAQLLDGLRVAADAEGEDGFRRVCVRAMRHHSSTRERLGILDSFYAQVLADLSPIRTVLDIACGLNPLAIPWMPLDEDVQYYAYDMYTDMVGFLNEFFALAKVQGEAQARDVIHSPPMRRADLALILKSLPCIAQLDRSASVRLLEVLNVDHLLISFPLHSLGGREKGMLKNYEQRFWEWVAGRPWAVQRFEFATELAFLVRK